jgi:flavin-dependent dehydrogenase
MTYDVVIIGGSLSGASAATLLLRKCPELRVLIVERAPVFTRRVGEATVEVSGYFLGRVLGLTHFLNETQLVKQGMRFWFANEQTRTLADASEIGPEYHVRLPSWQLDRSVVDEEVLRRAVAAGAELRRPAQVTSVTLAAGGEQTVVLKSGDSSETITCRWIVDASGVAALLARQESWLQPNTAHPTASAWCRWRGVKDWDGRELAERFPEWSAACYGTRHTATNHILGDGWWSWWIPLKGGEMSVGVVFDQRLTEFPGEGKIRSEFVSFFRSTPSLARCSRRRSGRRGQPLAEEPRLFEPHLCWRWLRARRRRGSFPRSALQPGHGLDLFQCDRLRGADRRAKAWRRACAAPGAAQCHLCAELQPVVSGDLSR